MTPEEDAMIIAEATRQWTSHCQWAKRCYRVNLFSRLFRWRELLAKHETLGASNAIRMLHAKLQQMRSKT